MLGLVATVFYPTGGRIRGRKNIAITLHYGANSSVRILPEK